MTEGSKGRRGVESRGGGRWYYYARGAANYEVTSLPSARRERGRAIRERRERTGERRREGHAGRPGFNLSVQSSLLGSHLMIYSWSRILQ